MRKSLILVATLFCVPAFAETETTTVQEDLSKYIVDPKATAQLMLDKSNEMVIRAEELVRVAEQKKALLDQLFSLETKEKEKSE